MKKVLLIAISMLLIVSLIGCSSTSEVPSSEPENNEVESNEAQSNDTQSSEEPKALTELTIGILPDVDSIPFIIAQENGYFQEEGLTVNIEAFKSPVDRDSALQSGNLDGAISDVLAVAFAVDNSFDVRIASMTNGSYKLLVNKDAGINDIKDLKGKDVAISKNTIIEYATDMMLTEAGLTPEDINKVVIPQIPTRLEMLLNGKLDGATLPEPLATTAIKGGAKLLNSSDNLGINPGILMFTSNALDEKEEEIKAMYRAYNNAIDFLNAEPIESYIDILIEKGGFPEDVRGAIVLPKYTQAQLPTEKDVNDVINWLFEKELIKTSFKYEDLVIDNMVR